MMEPVLVLHVTALLIIQEDTAKKVTNDYNDDGGGGGGDSFFFLSCFHLFFLFIIIIIMMMIRMIMMMMMMIMTICIYIFIESLILEAPKITVPPTNTTGDLYGTVVLNCTVSGTPQPRVIWFKDGREISDQNLDEYSFVIRELSLPDRGFYQCQAMSVMPNGTRQTTSRTSPVVVNINGKRKEGLKERGREGEKKRYRLRKKRLMN